METKLLGELKRGKLAHPDYSLRVLAYLFGQMRIQLLDHTKPDDLEPGSPTIVQELCTYKEATMHMVTSGIALAVAPLAFCRLLATPGNCEGNGSRIRLDSDSEYPRGR